jgi:hypothetical protein
LIARDGINVVRTAQRHDKTSTSNVKLQRKTFQIGGMALKEDKVEFVHVIAGRLN